MKINLKFQTARLKTLVKYYLKQPEVLIKATSLNSFKIVMFQTNLMLATKDRKIFLKTASRIILIKFFPSKININISKARLIMVCRIVNNWFRVRQALINQIDLIWNLYKPFKFFLETQKRVRLKLQKMNQCLKMKKFQKNRMLS